MGNELDQTPQNLVAGGEEFTSEEAAWYLRRLEGGLFTLQSVDYVLAWIAMEDDGVGICFLTRSFIYAAIRFELTFHKCWIAKVNRCKTSCILCGYITTTLMMNQYFLRWKIMKERRRKRRY
jgi:hypothetical protein